MNALVFREDDLAHLREHLLRESPNESATILLAADSTVGESTRLLIRERIPIPSDAYATQEHLRLVVAPTFLAPILKRARIEGWSLILTHSHPFARAAQFSVIDDQGEAILMPTILSRAPNRSHAAMVVGRDEAAARVW